MKKSPTIYDFINSYFKVAEKIRQYSYIPHGAKRIGIFHAMESLSKIEISLDHDEIDIPQSLLSLKHQIDTIIINDYPELSNKLKRNGLRNSGNRNK